MIKKNTKYAIFVILAVIILTGSLIHYFNYSLNLARLDYETKISDLNHKTNENLQILKTLIAAMGSNLSSQIGLIDTNLENFKKQNQQDISTLSELIDEIEKQSNIRLDELKDELKNIKIKSADFSAIVNDVLESVVSISTNIGQGSGAIIDSKGYIVTNLHVINGASTIKVTTYSGEKYDANTLVGYDATADLAVLKIDAPNLRALNFGDSDNIKVGEKVIAAGNPAGLEFTVTEGIVSAFRIFSNNIKYVQTDVPINPGNSGGPLVNTKGEIVGINNFKVGGFESLGFAVASNKVRSAVSNLINKYEAIPNQ